MTPTDKEIAGDDITTRSQATFDIDLECWDFEHFDNENTDLILLKITGVPESCILDPCNVDTILDIIGEEKCMEYWKLMED